MFKPKGIISAQNRLHGNIGYIFMDKYKMFQIDENDDLEIAEYFIKNMTIKNLKLKGKNFNCWCFKRDYEAIAKSLLLENAKVIALSRGDLNYCCEHIKLDIIKINRFIL